MIISAALCNWEVSKIFKISESSCFSDTIRKAVFKAKLISFPLHHLNVSLELQSTLVISNSKRLTQNTSGYPYLDISGFRE